LGTVGHGKSIGEISQSPSLAGIFARFPGRDASGLRLNLVPERFVIEKRTVITADARFDRHRHCAELADATARHMQKSLRKAPINVRKRTSCAFVPACKIIFLKRRKSPDKAAATLTPPCPTLVSSGNR